MEYTIYTSLEGQRKWNEAMADYIWSLKNPILDQPKQLWHRGNGFYKVLHPFGEVVRGDNVLLHSFTHTRVVKLATSTTKQVFYNYSKEFCADMMFTPEEWQTFLRPLTKYELREVLPHLTTYIKNNSLNLLKSVL